VESKPFDFGDQVLESKARILGLASQLRSDFDARTDALVFAKNGGRLHRIGHARPSRAVIGDDEAFGMFVEEEDGLGSAVPLGANPESVAIDRGRGDRFGIENGDGFSREGYRVDPASHEKLLAGVVHRTRRLGDDNPIRLYGYLLQDDGRRVTRKAEGG
jgi:hypothetical protein